MLTYRTRASYERRFGRNIMETPDHPPSEVEDVAPADYHRAVHNEGNHMYGRSKPAPITNGPNGSTIPSTPKSQTSIPSSSEPTLPVYATHSYQRYQASKFLERFDANCYIAMSRKMDAHDISEGREGGYEHIAASIVQPTLIFGKKKTRYFEPRCYFIFIFFHDSPTFFSFVFSIFGGSYSLAIETDVLYPVYEIQALSDLLPASEFVLVKSQEGHDGLLLEHKQVNASLVSFMQRQEHIRRILEQPPVPVPVRTVKGSLFASW